MSPESVLSPQSEAELVELVRAGKPLQVIGSGTKRHYGPAPAAEGQTVSLRKLCKITAYEPGDLVVTVQAGARLVDLQADAVPGAVDERIGPARVGDHVA